MATFVLNLINLVLMDHYFPGLNAFLADRYQQVTINGETNSPALVTSGVLQGMVLAPLLFLCYINDMLNTRYIM